MNCWDEVGGEASLVDVAGSPSRKRCVKKVPAVINAQKYDLGSAIGRLELFGSLESV